jgi:hypothetical protein
MAYATQAVKIDPSDLFDDSQMLLWQPPQENFSGLPQYSMN